MVASFILQQLSVSFCVPASVLVCRCDPWPVVDLRIWGGKPSLVLCQLESKYLKTLSLEKKSIPLIRGVCVVMSQTELVDPARTLGLSVP